jgi:hypothetical protein
VFMLLMTAVYVVHQGNINYAVEMLWQELQNRDIVSCPLSP